MTRILKITKSDCGIGPAVVWGVITPALIGSWQVWMLEWVESGGLQTMSTSSSSSFLQVPETLVGIEEPLIRLRTLRSWIARGVCALLRSSSWTIANTSTPLPRQVVLGLSGLAFVTYLEALDGARDAEEIERVVGDALNPVVGSLSDLTTSPSSSSTGTTSKQVNPGKGNKADEVAERLNSAGAF
jgi:phosphatidylinositol glycan class O